MIWLLAQKAENLELDKNQHKITREKARSAIDKEMYLLAIELRIGPDTMEHVVANDIGFLHVTEDDNGVNYEGVVVCVYSKLPMVTPDRQMHD